MGYGAALVGNYLGKKFAQHIHRRDPLVFDLNFDGVQLSPLAPLDFLIVHPELSFINFDLNGDGFAERTGWVSARDGLLSLDLNNNGAIDNGNELVGNSLQDGFQILRAYDVNNDGVINNSDQIYNSLTIWQDLNLDGVSQVDELHSLFDENISSIDLDAKGWVVDLGGNSTIASGTFSYYSGLSSDVIAVSFSTDQINTHFNKPADFRYDPDLIGLPNLRGFGSVPDLWVAMTLDPTLKGMVKSLVDSQFLSIDSTVGSPYAVNIIGMNGAPSSILYHYEASLFEDMMARWAGVAITTGNEDENQIQSTVEAFLNRSLLPGLGAGTAEFHKTFQGFSADLAVKFFTQVPELKIREKTLELANNVVSQIIENGGDLTEAQFQFLIDPFLSELNNQPQISPELQDFQLLKYDISSDTISGDIVTFIDSQLSSLTFDANNPWLGYASWFASHRLAVEAVDDDGSLLAQEHRKLTGNLALSILTGPFSELNGDLSANVIAGDQTGASNPDLIRGLGGNDTLQGVGGSDTYVFSDGSGVDTVIDASGTSDEIAFQGALVSTLARFSFANGNRSDLLIQFDGRPETVTVIGYFAASGAATIEKITFPDGPQISERTIRDAVMATLATVGNDTIVGFANGSAVFGGGGDDNLTGGAGDDRFVGGIGNDALSGLRGNDTYVFARGDGQDVATEYGNGGSGFDTIEFGADILPTDITVIQSDNGQDLILKINGTTDQITLDNTNTGSAAYKFEQVTFANGTVWSFADLLSRATQPTTGNDVFYGDEEDNALSGSAGDDTLTGSAGSDRLLGGTGNDHLYGNSGSDTYVFNLGDGQDVISEYDSNGGGFDTLEFGAGILPTDLTISQADGGNDIVIMVNGTTDQVTLDNTNTGSSAYKVDRIKFADGTSWNFADLLAYATTPTSGNDAFFGDETANTLLGGAGNDTLTGNAGNDRLIGGAGNDSLFGNSGDDTFVFGIGDGQDIASEYDSNGGGFDTVELGAGITLADITVTQADNGQDIVIKINGMTDQITLDNTNTGSLAYKIDQLRFADGSLLTFDELAQLSRTGTAGDDILFGDETANTISAGSGNDTVSANNGDDRLIGGTGDDSLFGGAGDDTYAFALGDGHDVMSDYGFGGFDTLELGAGIAPSDLSFQQTDFGNDIVISINGTSDQITLDNTNTGNANYKIDQVRFADGTLWSYADLLSHVTAATAGNDQFYGDETANVISGGAGNDAISGNSGDDRLSGGSGDDTLSGGEGNDTYVFSLGDGQDVLTEYGFAGLDTVEFGSGITSGMLTITRSDFGNDLVVKIEGTSDQLTLDNTNTGNANYRIDQFTFADGTIWDYATIEAHVTIPGGGNAITGSSAGDILYGTAAPDQIFGQAGNDTLYGGADSDTLYGGAGDDFVAGEDGSDTYVYASGDGNDQIFDENFSGGSDTLKLTNLNAANVTLRREGFHLYVKDNTTGQELQIQYQYHPPYDQGIETIQFADGSSWDKARINQEAWYQGTAGGDSLTGSDASETFHGATGDDYLAGGSGSDTYVYASGDGNDQIFDENFSGGSDTLKLTNLNAANVTLRREGFHLYVKDNTTGQELQIQYQYHPPYDQGIETIQFADGSSWDKARINQEAWYQGTAGGDSLTGSDASETFHGGTGDDYLAGGSGSDTYVYASGDGNDQIFDENFSGGADTLKLTNLNAGDISLRRDGYHLYVKDETTEQEIQIQYQYHPPYDQGIEKIAFADGSFWTRSDIDTVLNGGLVLTGSSGADSLTGSAGDDRLYGGSGDDSLIGGSGSDISVYAGVQADYALATFGGAIQIVDNQASIDGNDGTDTLLGVEIAEFKDGSQVSLAAPIVLDLDGNGIQLIDQVGSHATFDWNSDGLADATGWVGKGDGLLVYDRNGDGKVSGASEISFLNDKPNAKSDLDGLSAFDSNSDGVFNAADAKWSSFKVWRDKDGDGQQRKKELVSLKAAGITAINLTGAPVNKAWGWQQNITINTGSFSRKDGSVGALSDVGLRYTPFASANTVADTFSANVYADWGFDSFQRTGSGTVLQEVAASAGTTKNGASIQSDAARLAEAISAFGGGDGGIFTAIRETQASRYDYHFSGSRSSQL